MSAFIVEDKTVNRIVTFINANMRDGHDYPFKKLGYQLDQVEDLERLARDLHLLNCDAIDDRYGKGTAAEDVTALFTFHFDPATKLQVLKHAKCLRYQCSEGSVPERPLFKALDAFTGGLAEDICNDLPQYDQL